MALPRVHLLNMDDAEFEGLPFVLTSPRSLEACRRLGLEPVSLLSQRAGQLRDRMPELPEAALAAVAERLEAERRCRHRLALLERERIIDEDGAAPIAQMSSDKSQSDSWMSGGTGRLAGEQDKFEQLKASSERDFEQKKVGDELESKQWIRGSEQQLERRNAASEREFEQRKARSERGFQQWKFGRERQFEQKKVGSERQFEQKKVGSERQFEQKSDETNAKCLRFGSEQELHRRRVSSERDQKFLRFESQRDVDSRMIRGEESRPSPRKAGGGQWLPNPGILRKADSERQLRGSGRLGDGEKPLSASLRKADSERQLRAPRRPAEASWGTGAGPSWSPGLRPSGLARRQTGSRAASAGSSTNDYLASARRAREPPRALAGGEEQPLMMMQQLETMRLDRFRTASDRRKNLEAEIDDFRQEMRRLRRLAQRRALDAAERAERALRVL